MSITMRSLVSLIVLISGVLPGPSRAQDFDCSENLVEEALLADSFPGLDRTFFRLFAWREDKQALIKRKFEGVPTSPAVADVLRVSLTRADPKFSTNAGPERYQLAVLLRTDDREVQESLARVLEAEYKEDDRTLTYWGHQVTNAHVRDGDFWISFLEAPFARNVSMGIGVTRLIYDFLDNGGRMSRVATMLENPRQIAPPVIALPPPPGAKIH